VIELKEREREREEEEKGTGLSAGYCANLAWWPASMGWVAVEEADRAFEVVEVVPRGMLVELSIEERFEA